MVFPMLHRKYINNPNSNNRSHLHLTSTIYTWTFFLLGCNDFPFVFFRFVLIGFYFSYFHLFFLNNNFSCGFGLTFFLLVIVEMKIDIKMSFVLFFYLQL